MSGEGVIETLHVCREAHVYKIPPRQAGGHKSGEWQVADKIFTGQLRVLARGVECVIVLDDSNGKEFATCPIPPGERAQAVEPVSDSSRYFVLRLLDKLQPKRRAFVGLGFTDRADAFDFNVALSDHEKFLQRAQEATRARLESNSATAAEHPYQTDAGTLYQTRDLSLKEGETIKISMKRPGSANTAGRALGGGQSKSSASAQSPVGALVYMLTVRFMHQSKLVPYISQDEPSGAGEDGLGNILAMHGDYLGATHTTAGGGEALFKPTGACKASSVLYLCLDPAETRYLLACAADSSITAYDTAKLRTGASSGSVVFSLNRNSVGGHRYSVSTAAWYPFDTGLFVTGSADHYVKVWDANRLQVATSFELQTPIHAVSMSNVAVGHCLVAVASSQSELNLCDPQSGSWSHTLIGHREEIWSAAWSLANEWQLVTGGSDGQVRLWDIRTSGCLHVFDRYRTMKPLRRRAEGAVVAQNATAHEGAVTAVLPTADALHWITAGTDSRIRLWDSASLRNKLVNYRGSLNRSIKARQIAFAQDFGLLLHPSGSVVQAYDLLTGRLEFSLRGHMDAVNACCYNETTQELYTGSNDTQICLWSPSLDRHSMRDVDDWSS